MVITTGKSEYIYDNIFIDIKKIFTDNGNKIEDIPKRIMSDFEKSLINSIRKNFENSTVDGCFFHFVKLLWKKAKSLSLCNLKKLKNTKIFLFILKIILFMEMDKRGELFDKIEIYFGSDDENYKKLLLYYKKNWLNNPYINYNELSKQEYINRTNNFIESFHSFFNQKLETYHPKISFLIDKYKEYLISIYNKVKTSLVDKNEPIIKKFFILNDIILFIKNMNLKYKDGLNLTNILQVYHDENEIINKVTNYLLDFYFDIDTNDNQKNILNFEKEEPNIFDEISGDEEDGVQLELINNENEYLNFDEIFPINIGNLKGKKKRNYLEAFGEPNELKTFYDDLKLIKNNNLKEKNN